MTEHEKRIREALEAGPTGGKWRKTNAAEVMIGTRRLCRTTAAESLSIGADVERANVNAAYIAACNPSAIRALLADLDAMRGALLKIARMAEDLKKPCSMDADSPQAIRNGQYMNICYAAHAALKGASHE